MIFKKLGQTGITVSSIGQGTVDVGKYFDKVSYEYGIKYGIDHGLTFIDTAENYVDGMSETVIGNAIHGIRDKVVLSTKISSDNLKYDDVIRSAENSLKRLRVDAIDLYQIHWSNTNINIAETMRAFDKLYKDGKILNVGVSNFLPIEIEKSCHKSYSFGGIVSNQVEYNLYNRFAEKYSIPYCRSNNIIIISYSPLNRGFPFRNKKAFSIMCGLANKYNKTICQISLNWIASQEGIIAIPFSTNLEHIKQNSEAVDFVLDKDDSDLIINKVFGEIEYCNTKDIRVIDGGFRNYKVYKNKKEAIDNKLNFSPSPLDLARFLSYLTEDQIRMVNPIRAIISKDTNYKYDLVEGRIKYWSWVLAFGEEKDIPLYVIDKD